MKKLFLSLIFSGFLLPLTPTVVFAAEEAPEEVGDDTQYSYATVVSLSDKDLVVSEYDYEKDESVNVTYSLDPAVKLRNIASLKEIAVDDAVEIIYTVKDSKKIATAIAVDKNTEEEPVEGGEEPTEQPAPGTKDASTSAPVADAATSKTTAPAPTNTAPTSNASTTSTTDASTTTAPASTTPTTK